MGEVAAGVLGRNGVDAIAQAIDTITPQNARSYFTHAGFLNLNVLRTAT